MSKRRRRSLFTDRSSSRSASTTDAETSEAEEADSDADVESSVDDAAAAPDEAPPEPVADAGPPPEPEPEPEAEPEESYTPPEPESEAASDSALDASTAPTFGSQEAEDASTVKFESHGSEDAATRLDDGIGFGAMGNFDDAPPPTDEVPSAVLQDVSQPYTAPMNVPEPPPIPGILDRFTPAGAQQRVSSKQKESKPSYLADTPPPAPMLERHPDDSEGYKPRRKTPLVEAGSGTSPMVLVVGAIAVLGIGMGALALTMFALGLAGGGSGSSEVTDPNATEFEGRSGIKVKVQDGLRTTEDPEPLANPDGDADPDADPNPDEEPEPEPEPEPDPTPAPIRPQPVRPVGPRPTPKPDPAPVEESVSAMGTLKIRSNRKVLIYVDGKAVGYTPKSYKSEPGARTVSAMLPGQPQSKQTQTVDLKGGGTTPVEFTF